MALDIRSQLTHKETNKKIRILWLSEDDMVEAGVLDAGRAVDVMEEVVGLLEDGDAIMGGPDHDQHGALGYTGISIKQRSGPQGHRNAGLYRRTFPSSRMQMVRIKRQEQTARTS